MAKGGARERPDCAAVLAMGACGGTGKKEVEMSAHRVVAGMVMLLVSGLCAGGQGLRAPIDDNRAPQGFAWLDGLWVDSGRLSAAERYFDTRRQETGRFGQGRAESGFGLYQPLTGGWSTSLDLNPRGTELMTPQYSLLAQLGKTLSGGWGLSVGMQHSRYAATEMDLGTVTVERYFGNQRLAYTVASGLPEERGVSFSQRLQWSYHVGDRGFFGLSLAHGLAVDTATPEGLPTTDARNITLFGRYWFMPNWAVSAEAEMQEQVGYARRNGVRFGLRHQF
jgi:YaiO family outer membrane protein